MLTIQKYNEYETEGKKFLPDKFVEAFQPEVFQTVGWPTTIHSETEIYKYLDSMHEGRLGYYYERQGYAPTYEEFEMIKEIAKDIYQFSLNNCNKGIVVKASMLSSMDVLRRIRCLTKSGSMPVIFELGGGNGVLGAMLHKSGYPYISTDITQAFYLTQNNMWEGLFPNEVEECMDSVENLNEIVKSKMSHIPYWKLWDLKDNDLEADIMVSNHNLVEMHVNSLRFYLKYGKKLMRNSPYKLFVAQSSGGLVTKNSWEYLLRTFDEMGYRLLYMDEHFLIFCLNEKDSITPIDIEEILKNANTRIHQFVVYKNINDKTAGNFVAAMKKIEVMDKVSLNEIETFFHSLGDDYFSPGEEFMYYIDGLKWYTLPLKPQSLINYANILDLFRQNNGKKIVLYGAGHECDLLINALYKNNMEDCVKFIFDSNIEKAGTNYRGYKILFPTKQKIENTDIIFISSIRYAEDINIYLSEYGAKKESIYKITDYLSRND